MYLKLKLQCDSHTLSTLCFQMLLEENRSIRGRIHSVFHPLMAPHIKKVDIALQPGLVMLCWTSLNLDAFFKTVKAALRDLELLVKEV